MTEYINHPKHYNARKDGLECIDVIRHYTCDIANAIKYLWRDGLKPELGKMYAEKTIEDLRKALWYIDDQLYFGIEHDGFASMSRKHDEDLQEMLWRLTGKKILDIASYEYYGEHVGRAMYCLLHVGLINDGYVYRTKYAISVLREARKEIEIRIEELIKEGLSNDTDLQQLTASTDGII